MTILFNHSKEEKPIGHVKSLVYILEDGTEKTLSVSDPSEIEIFSLLRLMDASNIKELVITIKKET